MDDLRALLDQLDGERLGYVYARSRTSKTAEALREAGIARSSFYKWNEEERKRLDDMADMVRRNRVLLAEPKLQESIEKAVTTLVGLLEADSEMVKFQASKLIIERVMGEPVKKVDMTTAGEKLPGISMDDMAAIFKELREWEQEQRGNLT